MIFRVFKLMGVLSCCISMAFSNNIETTAEVQSGATTQASSVQNQTTPPASQAENSSDKYLSSAMIEKQEEKKKAEEELLKQKAQKDRVLDEVHRASKVNLKNAAEIDREASANKRAEERKKHIDEQERERARITRTKELKAAAAIRAKLELKHSAQDAHRNETWYVATHAKQLKKRTDEIYREMLKENGLTDPHADKHEEKTHKKEVDHKNDKSTAVAAH